eukprot:6467234-Amphidinium_carterae.3
MGAGADATEEEEQVVNRVGRSMADLYMEQEEVPAKGTKGRGKGGRKGKGGRLGGQVGRGVSSAASVQSSKRDREQSEDADGTGSSNTGAGGKGNKVRRLSAREKLLESAARYAETPACDALAGISMRVQSYQTKRILEALRDENAMDQPAYVTLTAKSELIKKCITLHDHLTSLTKTERMALLAEVMPQIDDVPTTFQSRLLEVSIKEMDLNSAGDVESWLDRVRPLASDGGDLHSFEIFVFASCSVADTCVLAILDVVVGEAGQDLHAFWRRYELQCTFQFSSRFCTGTWAGDTQRFDWRTPRMCDLDAYTARGESERCKLMQKLFVHDSMVRILARGAEGMDTLKLMSASTATLMREMLQLRSNPIVLEAACREVLEVAEFLHMIAGGRVPDPLVISSVMNGKAGVRVLIRNTVSQSNYWREWEAKARHQAAAMVTLMPEIEAALVELPKLSTQDMLHRIAPRLVVWSDDVVKTTETLQRNVEIDTLVSTSTTIIRDKATPAPSNFRKFIASWHAWERLPTAFRQEQAVVEKIGKLSGLLVAMLSTVQTVLTDKKQKWCAEMAADLLAFLECTEGVRKEIANM